jgi:hypothetical protein
MGGVEPFQVCYIFQVWKEIIYVIKMSDAGVHTIFEKDSCKMVREMVLMRGVHIGTLYKLLGSVNSTGCNNTIVPETDSIVPCLVDQTMLWNQRMGHIGKKAFELCTTKVWSKVSLIFLWKLIYMNIASMENIIM